MQDADFRRTIQVTTRPYRDPLEKAGTIDLPTVRTVILMIRQYKYLAHGKREFG